MKSLASARYLEWARRTSVARDFLEAFGRRIVDIPMQPDFPQHSPPFDFGHFV
jgi:hypothetical protein